MILFLDSMVWLHFCRIGDVNPTDLAPAGEPITILIPRIVMRELNKKKDDRRAGKLSDRARSALQLVEKAQDARGLTLKNGCRLEAFHEPSNPDYNTLGLDQNIADHCLIAAIAGYVRAKPDETVIFLTDDAAARITAKSLGLNAQPFPEKYRLTPEWDPIEKENRELKARIQTLENAQPKLECRFWVADQRTSTLKVTIADVGDFQTSQMAAALDGIRRRYERPVQRPSRDPVTQYKEDVFSQFAKALGHPSDDEISRYERDASEFIKDYEKYSKAQYEYTRIMSVSAVIDFVIANVGTKPADDVDLLLHFPDGFGLEDEIPEAPVVPEPPLEPRSSEQIFKEHLQNMQHFALPTLYPRPMIDPAPRLSTFEIKKTNSYEVTQFFKRIKHGHQVAINQVFLTFSSFVEAASFQVDYTLTAANIPQAITGVLNVVVER